MDNELRIKVQGRAASFLAAQFLDVGTTYYALYFLGATELNPLVWGLIETYGFHIAVYIKLGVAFFMSAYFLWRGKLSTVNIATWITWAIVTWNMLAIVSDNLWMQK